MLLRSLALMALLLLAACQKEEPVDPNMIGVDPVVARDFRIFMKKFPQTRVKATNMDVRRDGDKLVGTLTLIDPRLPDGRVMIDCERGLEPTASQLCEMRSESDVRMRVQEWLDKRELVYESSALKPRDDGGFNGTVNYAEKANPAAKKSWNCTIGPVEKRRVPPRAVSCE